MSWSFIRPKNPMWFSRAVSVALAAVALYLLAAWWAPWSPGRLGGLIAGNLAAAVFAIEGLYPLRRRLMKSPLNTAQRWLQFHIYAGLVACLLVLIHIGFRLPAGQFGWWLLALTVWTTASGLLGVWLQKWIPDLIVNNLTVEALYERIPELVSRLQGEGDKVVAGASEMLTRTYHSEVRPLLGSVSPSWSYLLDIRGRREQRMTPLRHIGQFLSEEEQTRLADLQGIFGEKTELDAQFSLQRALRLWVILHLPPSMLLLALLLVHIISVLYY